jgi:hypothetical protein
MKASARNLTLAICLSLSGVYAQVQVIPQVADGAGWATTIVLTNTTATTQLAQLKFNQAVIGGGGATSPWTPPFNENVALSAINLPAGATLFLHTPGTAATLTQGWGELDAVAGVVGYAIFTSHAPGNPAQDATAPASTAASRILVPFDNTSHLITAVAVVNPNATAETVLVNIRTSDGAISNGTLPNMPTKGQRTFLMPTQFPGTAGKSGLAEFYTNSGTISIIALRANPSGAFTTAPVYPESGPPIIGANNMPVDVGVSAFIKSDAAEFVVAPQRQIIPQAADGDGWASTIVVINTSANTLNVTLKFNQRIGTAGATMPWNPPFKESISLTNLSLPGGSALFLHTPGTSATLTQGWGELDSDPAVVGYAIFTSAAPGNPAQDATAPAVAATSRILVPFDNTSGFIAAIALANPNAAAEAISVNIRTSDGATSTGTLASLPGEGQTTFLMPTLFTGTAGKSGLAEFFVTSGSFSIIALRANPSGAFTAAPVYFETGAPIISTGGGGTGGNIVSAGMGIQILTSTLSSGDAVFGLLSGAIGRYSAAEWNGPYAGPKFGPCLVYDVTYPTSGRFPSVADAYLDAGASLGLSGPNLASGTTVPALPAAGIGPVYNKIFPAGTFTPGGTYTLTGTGGTQVSAFSVSATLPDSFTVTNWAALATINRAGPVTITWTGSGFDEIAILLSGSEVNGANTHTVVMACAVPGNLGTFALPVGGLSLLPAVPPGSFSSSLLVQALKGDVNSVISPESSTAKSFLPTLVGGGQADYGVFGASISFARLPTIQ